MIGWYAKPPCHGCSYTLMTYLLSIKINILNQTSDFHQSRKSLLMDYKLKASHCYKWSEQLCQFTCFRNFWGVSRIVCIDWSLNTFIKLMIGIPSLWNYSKTVVDCEILTASTWQTFPSLLPSRENTKDIKSNTSSSSVIYKSRWRIPTEWIVFQ